MDALKPIIRCFRANRELLRTKDKEARSEYIMETFKSMLVCDNSTGQPVMVGKGFTHDWWLVASDSPTDRQRVTVCRDVFTDVMGITLYEMEKASTAFRDNSSSVRNKALKQFTDKDVLQFDFPATKEIF